MKTVTVPFYKKRILKAEMIHFVYKCPGQK